MYKSVLSGDISMAHRDPCNSAPALTFQHPNDPSSKLPCATLSLKCDASAPGPEPIPAWLSLGLPLECLKTLSDILLILF